jgi:hypothetical protein
MLIMSVNFVKMAAEIRVPGALPEEIVGYIPGDLILVATINLAVGLLGGRGMRKSELTGKVCKLSALCRGPI